MSKHKKKHNRCIGCAKNYITKVTILIISTILLTQTIYIQKKFNNYYQKMTKTLKKTAENVFTVKLLIAPTSHTECCLWNGRWDIFYGYRSVSTGNTANGFMVSGTISDSCVRRVCVCVCVW